MKKTILLFFLMVSMVYFGNAYAQRASKPFSFGIGIEGGQFMGDANFKETFNAEAGLSLRFSVKAGPGFVTLSPGARLVIPKSISEEDIKLGSHIPLRIGYKYIFARKFFVMAEGGYSQYTFYSADVSNESDEIIKEKSGGFSYAPSVGVNLGSFEAGIRYESTNLKDLNTKISLLGLRLGFNF